MAAKDKKGDYQAVEGAKPQKAQKPFQVQAWPPCTVLINPFAWLLWIIDFLAWLVLCSLCCCGPCKMLKFFATRCCATDSVPNPADEKSDYADETNRRRNGDLWEDGLLEYPYEDEDNAPETVWELAARSFGLYADKACFGTRKYLGKQAKTDDNPFPKVIFGETEWTKYKTVGEQAVAFGAGLRSIGLQPLPAGVDLEKTNGPHTLLIFEDTCQEWMTSLIGAHSQSVVVATSYATLGISAVVEAIKECNVSAVLCNRKNIAEMEKVAPDVLKTIIYTNYGISAEEAAKPVKTSRIKAISFEEILALGQQNAAQFPVTPPAPANLAVIMYTSGSTGKPKGVMIPHSSVVASAAGLRDCLHVTDGEETYIAYLPAAHIFEFCAELSMLLIGAEIGFSDTRTITSKGAVRQLEDGSLNEDPGWPNPPGGIQEYAPTLMVAVPVVWDTFKKTIEDGVGKQKAIVQWLFQVSYSAAYYARRQGRSCPLFNLLVFGKISKMIGGKLKFGVSGGGPISQDVQEFMSVIGGFPLIQGYALTESCCAGTAQDITDPDPGNVGGPLGSVELKLNSCDGPEDPADSEGMQYLATDDEHKGVECIGRGEVCIRGPSMSNGYFKQPEVTRQAWDNEGWFHTGDIAYWDTKGRLHIVDRLKNLIKLKGGEYIATENMEKEYGTSAFVRSGITGGIMCYGDGDLRRPVAIVQVNMPELKKWAAGAGVAGLTDEALCQNADARKAVLSSLMSAAKDKLGKNEGLIAVGLSPGTGPAEGAPSETSPWSAENGCRTASGKLDRKGIQKAHAGMMEELKKAAA